MDKKHKEDGRESMISWHMDKIDDLDEAFYDAMILTAKAYGKLITEGGVMLDYINKTEFGEAALKGISTLSDAFINLQKCLGEIERLVRKKHALVDEIYKEYDDDDEVYAKDEIRKLMEDQMGIYRSRLRFKYLDFQIGEHTLSRLEELKAVRYYPIELIAEAILANVMRSDKLFEVLKEENRGKPSYVEGEDMCFSAVKFREMLTVMKKQEKKRLAGLF